jgi:hypothetical protein
MSDRKKRQVKGMFEEGRASLMTVRLTTAGSWAAATTSTSSCSKGLSWDPEKSFEPIVYTHLVPLVFAIHPQIPARTLPE